MKSWEFLLQKEGDRTWLPLENLTVEILEGRYRVVARTPHVSTDIDIYVSYISSEDDPPKRRVQQRKGQSNGEGLLAILPFTPFRPGRWELRCRPHVAAGDPAQQWHSQVQLQVLPQASLEDEDLFGWDAPGEDGDASSPSSSPKSSPNPSPAAAAAALDSAQASDADLQQLAHEMSQMVLDSVMGAAGLPVPEAAPPSGQQPGLRTQSTQPVVPPSVQPPGLTPPRLLEPDREPPQLAIALQDNLLVMASPAAEGQSANPDVGVRCVEIQGEIISLGAAATALPDLLLTLELRDPSTREIWASDREMFTQSKAPLAAPLAFSTQLRVPRACRAQLLLGNATLWQADRQGALTQLTHSDFHAMVPVDDLLQQIRPDSDIPSDAEPADNSLQSLQQQAASNFLVSKFGDKPQPRRGNVQINTELLSLLKPTGSSQGQTAVPRSRSAPARAAGDRPAISLPNFGRPYPGAALPDLDSGLEPNLEPPDPDNLPAAQITVEMAAVPPDLDSDRQSGLDSGLDSGIFADDSLDPSAAPDSNPFDGDDFGFPNDAGSARLGPEATDSEITENPFALPDDGRQLDLDELLGTASANSAAELSELLGAAPAVESGLESGADGFGAVEAGQGPDGAQFDLGQLNLGQINLGQPDSEQSDAITSLAPYGPAAPSSTEVVVEDEPIARPSSRNWMEPESPLAALDPDLPVPEPELSVPELELHQGQTVRIQVRVAPSQARLCAKLWMLDCQSRTLVGQPQWITAFLPLNEDWVEANVDLVIPEGSIELQFEAIAVEPISQRESLKVSARRAIRLDDAGLQTGDRW